MSCVSGPKKPVRRPFSVLVIHLDEHSFSTWFRDPEGNNMKKLLLALVLVSLALLARPAFAEEAGGPMHLAQATQTAPAPVPAEAPPAKIDTGDTAWVLASSALVLLMTPGLALFYGGMVRRKNVLGTIMHSFVAMGIITIQWVLFGYSLSFGPDI